MNIFLERAITDFITNENNRRELDSTIQQAIFTRNLCKELKDIGAIDKEAYIDILINMAIEVGIPIETDDSDEEAYDE